MKPSSSIHAYAYYDAFADGETLPNVTPDDQATLVWYATIEDLSAEINPIIASNGSEIYANIIAI